MSDSVDTGRTRGSCQARPDKTEGIAVSSDGRTSSARLAGLLAGLPFIVLGYEAASEPGGRVDLAAALGVPSPELAVRVNGAAMVAGGLGLATGVQRRLAALGLVASLVPTTIAGHPFWQRDDAAQRKGDRIQVLKNIGLAGAALAVGFAPPARR